MDADAWTCGRCTLQNEGESAGVCQACGCKRGAEPSESEVSSSDPDDSDGGADYDMATGMDGPAEAAHTVEIHVARRKWETTENSRLHAREEALAGGSAVASFDEKRAAAAQIFTSQARWGAEATSPGRRGYTWYDPSPHSRRCRLASAC